MTLADRNAIVKINVPQIREYIYKLYITNVSSNTITYATPEFYVGRRVSTTPEPFIGSIATSQIYNRVLSAQEILQNYNAYKGRFGL